MRVTKQEIQIVGVIVIAIAAILYAFSDYVWIAVTNEFFWRNLHVRAPMALSTVGILCLLLPIAIPGLQNIIQRRELPALVIAPEDSPKQWKRAQGEIRALFYALVVVLVGLVFLLFAIRPGSRLAEGARAHTRVIGAIRHSARVAAFTFSARDPAAGWRPFSRVADAQALRDSLRDAPALAVLCRLLRSSNTTLMQEASSLPREGTEDPVAYARAAWQVAGRLRPEDEADLAHVYLLLGRFMLTQSDDGRFLRAHFKTSSRRRGSRSGCSPA